MNSQLEELECAKAAYLWLLLVTFSYLSLPLLTFPYLSLPFLMIFCICARTNWLTDWLTDLRKLRLIGLLSQPKMAWNRGYSIHNDRSCIFTLKSDSLDIFKGSLDKEIVKWAQVDFFQKKHFVSFFRIIFRGANSPLGSGTQLTSLLRLMLRTPLPHTQHKIWPMRSWNGQVDNISSADSLSFFLLWLPKIVCNV